MYDWANSIWATNIMSAIFPIFFAMMATDRGDVIYGYAVSVGNLAVAVLAPYLGAIGDFRGMKKKLWAGFMLAGVIFTAVMGIAGSWQLMLVGFVISRIGFVIMCIAWVTIWIAMAVCFF
jgi:UMF1 family MFS transporter